MFFKKSPLKKKKIDIADNFNKITSWPLEQIGLEAPKGKKAVKAIEDLLSHVKEETILSSHSYILAIGAAINMARNSGQHGEASAACMFSASAMIAVGGADDLDVEDIKVAKQLAETAKEILLKYKDNIEYQLNVNLVINMAMNALNYDILKPSKCEDITTTQEEIISKLSKLSESNNEKTCKMTIQPTNEIFSWDFNFSDEELETANELVDTLYDLRGGDFISPVYKL